MTFRKRLTIALLVVFALVGSACGSDDSSSTKDNKDSGFTSGQVGKKDTDSGTAIKGGTLTVASFVEIPGLDPIAPIGNGCCGLNELAAIYDTLMRYDPDTAKFEPQLAESLESNDELTEWTLKLRPDVTFTDGTPLDAEAVVFNLKRHDKGRFASLIGLIESFETPDATTVVMKTSSPWAGLPFMLTTMPGLIGSKKALEADPEGFSTKPVGAGAFKLSSWTPGEELVLERNPDYWGGEANLDKVRFVVLPDPLASLSAGDIDVSIVRAAIDLDKAESEGMSGYVNHQNAGLVILLNNCAIEATCDDPGAQPTSDVRVREALTLAIDPAVLDKQMNGGKGGNSYDLFSKTSRWHTTSTIKADPDKARTLLAEYMKETGWDGKLALKTTEELGVAIQSQANAVGFDIEIKTEDVGQLIKSQTELDYQILASSWNIDDAYPYANLANRLESSRPTNTISYKNETMDGLIEQLRGADGDEAVQDILDKVQAEMDKTFPSLVLGAVPEGFVWTPKVHGIMPTSTSGILLQDAYLEK